MAMTDRIGICIVNNCTWRNHQQPQQRAGMQLHFHGGGAAVAAPVNLLDDA